MLGKRDPAALREAYPWIAAVTDKYFRAEVEGVEHLSAEASLIVSTHNGGTAMPDLYSLFVAFSRRFGIDTPAYGMAHAALFQIPVFGPTLEKFGAIPASRQNASTVLREGFPLLICPGGDEDSLKPFSRRHEVNFGKRRGFIRLAIREQAPIVPIVSVGAHEVVFMLNDGRGLAKALRLDKIARVKTAPFSFGFPNGLSIAGLGSIPLPSKIKLRVLPPIFFNEPPSAADDSVTVERCYERVRQQMQLALSELASQRRLPVFG